MFQRQSPFHSRDDLTMDQFGNRLTNGAWSFIKHILQALVEANAHMITMVLRKKQGLLMFSFGKFFWMVVWFGIAWVVFWEPDRYWLQSVPSRAFISWHVYVAIGLFIVKWGIATFSIGSESSRWFRARDAMGTSILWPVFAWFLRPLGLVKDQGRAWFFQLNQRRWMLIIEPLFILILASMLYEAGLRAYSNFLSCAGIAFAYTTFRALKNRDMEKQMDREAELMS